MDKTPHELLGMSPDTQLCFCGPHENGAATALPDEPLAKHNLGCLIWDWAMAMGKITPKKRADQVQKVMAPYEKWMASQE
jgi:hypothetical protein